MFVLLVAGFVYLARKYDIIRDPGELVGLPADAPAQKKAYSLGRTQMALWTFLVAGALMFLFGVTWNENTLTSGVVVLIGISFGTTLLSATAEGAPKPKASKNFWADLVSDDDGPSFQRCQMVLFTMILAVIFAVKVVMNLVMPEFDPALKGDYTDFRLSPDEKSLAVSLVDPKAGTVDVWMSDLARGTNTRVTHEEQLGASALWSPDGTHLAFRTIRNGLIEFYQKSAGGGGDAQAVMSAEMRRAAQIQGNNIIDTDWSPDGRSMLFSSPGVAAGNDLWRLPLDGDRKPQKYLATPAEEMHGNFSPDGHLVAYTSNESGKFEVYVQTFPRLSDLKKQVSISGGYEPRWRADGREIYYLSEDRKLMAVSVGPGPSFGVPQPLFQARVPVGVTANCTHYVPSRDGRRFLVNTQSTDASPTPITVVLNWTAGLKK